MNLISFDNRAVDSKRKLFPITPWSRATDHSVSPAAWRMTYGALMMCVQTSVRLISKTLRIPETASGERGNGTTDCELDKAKK